MTEKPERPLGLSIAIIISFALFSLLPIAQVIFILLLRQQFQTIEFLESGGAIGGDLTGFGDIQLFVPLVGGCVFLIIAVLAWRGRPPAIRFMFVVTVLLITVATIALTIAAALEQPSLEQGFDSAAGLVNTLLGARIVVSVLVALYVIWYTNRGPARAFYRGYYLPDPDAVVEAD
jgi:hypothetical protein